MSELNRLEVLFLEVAGYGETKNGKELHNAVPLPCSGQSIADEGRSQQGRLASWMQVRHVAAADITGDLLHASDGLQVWRDRCCTFCQAGSGTLMLPSRDLAYSSVVGN